MRSKLAVTLALSFIATTLLIQQASSQEPAKPAAAKPPAEKPAAPAQSSPGDMKKMMEGMKKWMDSIQPGKHHELLNQFVGTWETATRIGMGKTETKGLSEVKWILGKRFLLEEYKGEMLMPDASGGMKPVPYEALGQWGYDNNRNLYVGTWASTVGTNLQTMSGTADPGGKLFRFYGEMDEPMLDMYGRMVKFEVKIESEDKHVLTIYDLAAGDDHKAVEITYTRKK